MKSYRSFIAASSLALVLSGCVISVHDGDDGYTSSWKNKQKENAELISQLQLGTLINDVTADLGGADDSEGFSYKGADYVVLYYRTRHVRSDGETTRDETTPLVFKNGKLIGWGEALARSVRP